MVNLGGAELPLRPEDDEEDDEDDEPRPPLRSEMDILLFNLEVEAAAFLLGEVRAALF
jgi:hypothetical protein